MVSPFTTSGTWWGPPPSIKTRKPKRFNPPSGHLRQGRQIYWGTYINWVGRGDHSVISVEAERKHWRIVCQSLERSLPLDQKVRRPLTSAFIVLSLNSVEGKTNRGGLWYRRPSVRPNGRPKSGLEVTFFGWVWQSSEVSLGTGSQLGAVSIQHASNKIYVRSANNMLICVTKGVKGSRLHCEHGEVFFKILSANNVQGSESYCQFIAAQ